MVSLFVDGTPFHSRLVSPLRLGQTTLAVFSNSKTRPVPASDTAANLQLADRSIEIMDFGLKTKLWLSFQFLGADIS